VLVAPKAGLLHAQWVDRAVLDQAGAAHSARIEALRALAALGVLVGHAWGWSQGYGAGAYDGVLARALLGGGFGVFLFFALTGYLLFLPFARASWGDGPPVPLRRYARNRVLRILPLYWVVVGTYLVLLGDGLRDQWWRFALMLQSFSPETVAKVVPPVWSLIVEVQFYLLLPLLAAGLRLVAGRSLRRAAGLVLALTLAGCLLRWGTVITAQSSLVWRYSLPATACFFGPGLLLALLQVGWERGRPQWTTRSRLAEPWVWVAAAALLTALVIWRYEWDLLLLPACFLLLGAAVLPLRSDRGLRWLGWRPLGLLGLASYSLYLWHEPLVRLLAQASWLPDGFGLLLLASGSVSILVAVVSYRLVELPFLRLRKPAPADRHRIGALSDDAPARR